MLTISVKNFGPIAEGSVDLKPLTIFVGPSNTGKSYMATAVHAIAVAAGTYGGSVLPSGQQNPYNTTRRFRLREQFDDSEELYAILDSLWEWAEKKISTEQHLPRLIVDDLPENVRLWLEEFILQQFESFQGEVVSQLRQIYGGESGFIRRESNPGGFGLSVHRGNPALRLEVRLSDALKLLPEFDISQTNISEFQLDLISYFLSVDEDEYDDEVVVGIVSNLAESVAESAFSEWVSQSFYLPAARSGISQGHKILSAALVRQSRMIGLERLSVPTLPGITTEFLSLLISIDPRMVEGWDNAQQKAVAFIETEVLHGKIDLDESAGLPYPEIAYESAAGKFGLEHTSSMVSELAPLVLFLKYLVRPGDLLILEEPESHLHPAAQLQLARGIARLVNAGVQVLITTHSGDFMGQIDNLLRMSNSSEKTARSLGLEQEDCLSPEQVSAYGFRFDSGLGGAVNYRLPVGSDVGIEDEEFLPVAELLYHQAIDLEDARLT